MQELYYAWYNLILRICFIVIYLEEKRYPENPFNEESLDQNWTGDL